MVDIVEAAPEQYGDVADALVDAFGSTIELSPLYEADLRDVERHAKEYRIWTAQEEGDIAGVVLTPRGVLGDADALAFTRSGEREFRQLAVRPQYRGRGVARALIDHAVRSIGALGIGTVEIHTGLRMVSARRLYESYGFTRRPERETFVVDGGYRIVTYTYRIPERYVAHDPVVDEWERTRPYRGDAVADGPGSIAGFTNALDRAGLGCIVSTDPDDIARYEFHRSAADEEHGLAVAWPDTSEQAAILRRVAERYGVPVTWWRNGTFTFEPPARSGLIVVGEAA